MAVNRRSRPSVGYGLDNALQSLAPQPIKSTRNPSTSDVAEIGTLWINKSTDAYYILTSVAAGAANWEAQSTGSGTFAAVEVTGGSGDVLVVDAGGDTVLGGDLSVTGDSSFIGNVAITGDISITGDFDITDTGSIGLTSTNNAAGAITLTEDGGTSGSIILTALQGTDPASIDLVSVAGGIRLESNLDAANAIVITSANGGGIEVIAAGTAGGTKDLVLQSTASSVHISGGEAVADAITLAATTGGITATAGGGAGLDIVLQNVAGSVTIESGENVSDSMVIKTDAGVSEKLNIQSIQGTGVASINVASTVGGITLTSNLATDDGININAVGGGVDIDGALQVNIASSKAAVANSVRIVASAADGGMDIDAGTGGITIDSTGAFSIDGAAASNVTTTGAGIDLTLSSVLGSVLVSSTENAALAIRLHADGGSSETIQLHVDQGSSVGSINLLSDVGGITFTATGLASADAINLEAPAGGIDWNSALQSNIDSSQAAVDAIRVIASDVAGGIDVDCGTGGITVDSTGAFSIDGAAASNVTTTGAGIDLTLSSVLGSVLVSSTENAALAIYLHADGGSSETIRLRADQGSGIGSIALVSDVGGVQVTSGALAATTGLNLVQGAVNASIQVGSGDPVHSAPQGSLYIKTDASTTTTRLWINTNGTTGWTYFTSNA